ncbi:MFS transporter [Microbacterium sp. NPDC091313]
MARDVVAEPTVEPAPPTARARIWSRGFVALFVISLVANMAQSMMVSLVPVDAAGMGATPVMVGVVSGAFAISALAVRPLIGATTLRFRIRSLLMIDLAVLVVAFVLYACAPSVEMLLAARLVHGVGMGFLAPLTLALVADALPESRMASGVGIFSLGQAIALGVGPALGLFVAGYIGFSWTFGAGAALMAIATGLVLLVRPDTTFRPVPFRIRLRGLLAREALLPACVILLLAGPFAVINTFVVLKAQEAGIAHAGLFFTVYAGTLLLARPLTGRLADRFGFRAVVIPSVVLFSLSLVMLSIADSLLWLLVTAAVVGLGYGVCQPLLQTIGLLSVRKEDRALAGSTIYTGVDLAYLLAPVGAGVIAASGATTADGYTAMFLWAAVPVAAALVVLIACGRRLASARRATR